MRPRRRREPPQPAPNLEIDPAIIANLPKMNFELLLVMLMRENGKVTLTQSDLDAADDARHNICFALSLDGKALEVFVVSAQSGIIRSPEANLWAPPNAAPSLQPQPGASQHPQTMAPGYNSPPPPPEPTEADLREQAQSILRDWQRTGLADGELPQHSPQPDNRIVEMPAQGRAKTGPETIFPFQVGSSPQEARQVNMSDLQTRLTAKDQQIAQEEAAAAARVEGG